MVRIAYSPEPDSLTAVDRREWPLYSLAEVAYFLGIPKTTLHSWTKARKNGDERVYDALIAVAEPKHALFSFYNLIEAHILSVTTRVHSVRVNAIRRAIAELQDQGLATGSHPLLSKEFHTDGKDLFVKLVEKTVNLSRGGQLALKPILDQYLKRIERDENFRPTKLFPSKKDKVVAIVPSVSSGRPTIDGTGIPVASIWSRYKAGDTISFIAEEYDIEVTQVEGAISYIEHLKAA